MKKKYVVITIFTLILSLVTFNHKASAQEDSGQTSVRLGFSNERIITSDQPVAVPPTGGESSNTDTHHKTQTPVRSDKLPQTGELVNGWLIFNGCLLVLMMLFIYDLTRITDKEQDGQI